MKNLLLFFLTIYCININAQFTNYFINYSIADYQAGNQNWDIKSTADGKIYVANNDGLLEFDGINWNLWSLPNHSTIRSLLIFKDRIYTGSYEDFGYFKRNNRGILKYTSLKKKEQSSTSLNQEFWQIKKNKNIIYFRSFARVYEYNINSNQLNYFDFPSTVMSLDILSSEVYVSTLNNGIFKLKSNKPQLFFKNSILNNLKLIAIKKIKNNILICSELHGMFILQNNNLVPWNCQINKEIKKVQLNKFVVLTNGRMVFGTIKNGIYITDKSGNILQKINKNIGLINNTVLGISLTNKNELLVGLDNGISYINLTTSTSFFTDLTGKLGAVYDLIKNNNRFYIGSNTGLYSLKNNELQFIKGSQGQVWYLKKFGNKIVCGHNNGLFRIYKNKLIPISTRSGSWVIKKVPGISNLFLEGTYTGLNLYRLKNGKWNRKFFKEINFPIRYIAFETKSTVWVAHPTKGVYKIIFNKNYSNIKSIINYSSKGLYSDFKVKLFKVNNTITFKTMMGWQKYEPLIDSIIPFKIISTKLTDKSNIISNEINNKLYFKLNNSIIETPVLNLTNKSKILLDFIKDRFVRDNEKIIKINDSTLALTLYDGFMLFNPNKVNQNEKLDKPKIEKIIINDNSINFSSKKVEVPYSNNYIKFFTTSSFALHKNFEYKLTSPYNPGIWQKSNTGIIEFSNLTDNEYKLFVRLIDSNLNKSEPLIISFTVLKPWYKGKIGMTIYSIIFLIIVLVIYKINRWKIKKERELLKNKMISEQNKLIKEQEIENEKKLIKLKNNALKNELKLKNKELANTAILLVKKDDTLQKIKSDLINVKKNFTDEFLFKKIIKEINYSIDHQEEWKLFEYNFNQVHEDFFNTLSKRHPKLNSRELKTCAFIKMELSSKEIAPLLRISVRGVETLRYRIKQKMKLNSELDLSSYLKSLK